MSDILNLQDPEEESPGVEKASYCSFVLCNRNSRTSVFWC